MSDDTPKIKVFASDDNLKALGELLSNDSSRSIIYNLMTREMYTNEISTKLDMRVSLVIHHLKKLEDLGLLEITEKKIKRKGQEHRFFQIKSNIFVVLDNTKEEIKEKGFLRRVFRDGIKFASIVTAFFITWGFERVRTNTSEFSHVIGTGKIPSTHELGNFVVPLIIVIIALVIIIIKKR